MRRVVLVLAWAVATMTCFTGTAHADLGNYVCTTTADQPSYKGWARLQFRGCVAPGMASTADCRALTAYRWTGAAWRRVTLDECAPIGSVYAWPYAFGWTWIWTQNLGWLAVSSSSVEIRAGYTSSCPQCR